MDYVFLAVAVVCIGFQFAATKLYQKRAGTSLVATLIFGAGSSAVAVVIFCAASLFKIEFTPLSTLIAAGVAFGSTVCNVAGIKAMSCGKVAVYSQFMMLGGMLVPFVYGVCVWGEHAGVWRYIALVLLICSLILPTLDGAFKRKKSVQPPKAETEEEYSQHEAEATIEEHSQSQKTEEKCSQPKKRTQPKKTVFYILCVAGFICNGAVSVLSKTHQISTGTVSTFNFMVAVYLFMIAFSGVALAIAAPLCAKKKRLANGGEPQRVQDKKARLCRLALTAAVIAFFAVVCSGGYVMQLLGACNLPSVLLYPAVTGGTVILTALFGVVFFKEKINKLTLCGILLAFAATFLFLL